MQEPTIEIIPIKPASRSDQATTLDVLVRITPPIPEIHFVRPPINLGLVLDRSGSMAGAKKIQYAQDAACLVVEQLLPTDRLSITIFDSEVETIAANAPVADKVGMVRQIRGIIPRGSTDLHGGWKEGGKQVEANHITTGLNRVILLSDGLANCGVTDANVIAREVKTLAARGVTTTTMGLGDDYNEDMMQALGEAGDGNYYYIESPLQLVDIFHTELQGLMANFGQKARLRLETHAGTTIAEVLNDMDRDSDGRLILPNLIVGMPISIVVRLKVPAMSNDAEVFRIRLAWDEPNSQSSRALDANLTLTGCPSEVWDTLPTEPDVTEQVAFAMAARARKEAIAAYDQGDWALTRGYVEQARAQMAGIPETAALARELAELSKLEADLAQGDGAKFRKAAAFHYYRKKHGHDV